VPDLELAGVARSLSDRLDGVLVRLEEDLCRRPRAAKDALGLVHPQRLVFGLCSSDYPQVEVQAHARRAGLDPLGVQVVDLGRYRGANAAEWTRAALAAAVARARAFPGSQPENLKAALLRSQQKVSRRAFFTLPPVSYLAVPTFSRRLCRAPEGCDQCVGACPNGSLEKDGDTILVDRARCLSCGICVAVCPQRAVEFPGWSPQEMEAELSALLEADLETRAVLFFCRSSPAPAGNGWLPVRMPCTAAVPVAAILQALAQGATAIGLYPCSDGCPTGQGDALRGRVDYCRELLALLGDSPERVQLLRPNGDRLEPAPRLPPVPGEASRRALNLFGRGAAAQAVKELAARYGAREGALEHACSPLGIVQIDPQACTACGSCTAGCPTEALLSYRRDGDGVVLAFDPCFCTGCGQCVSLCPEKAAGAIAVTPTTDLRRLASGTEVAFQDREVCCQRCGAPIAARRTLQRIASLLGDEYNPQLIERLCPNCRGIPSAAI
jgi:ferredoxin